MGGIAVAFGAGRKASVASLTQVLFEHLSHRGPDGVGVRVSGRSVVAHARLAVIDELGGQQPMHSEDGRFLLACNGEIYNHRQLRSLLSASHRFRTESDSEVVLHLVEETGAESIRQLDGMFAFFITDGDRFIAARDPFGIKPLYFGEDSGGGLWFASEIKALVERCTSFGTVPPGTFITESRRIKRWFEPPWAGRSGTQLNATPGELTEHLERAVVKRLMSDVPVGVLLSGGLKSSFVAALARRHLSRVSTFSAGVDGAPDLAAARAVANEIGSDHHELVYSVKDVSRRLDEVIYHLESYEPLLIRGAFPCYFASAMASEQVKVVLTGEGADALFAGQSYLRHVHDPDVVHRECVRQLFGLHALELQLIDRMTMAHGVEGRVPFLDVGFANWAMAIDPRLKLWRPEQPERWLLRGAAESVLPREIAQRPKLDLAQGTGTDLILEGYAESRISDRDFACAAVRFPSDTPRSKEELLYRLIFDDLFPGEPLRRMVSRWRAPGTEPWLS